MAGLATSREQARHVRELSETLEQRLLGRTWTVPELAVGFTNDAAYVVSSVPSVGGPRGLTDTSPSAALEGGLTGMISASARERANLARECAELLINL
jgi:hypothetical protein